MDNQVSQARKSWSREQVEKTLREILVDALGVDEDQVVPQASLVHDLGAESIDFLDIGFRVQQTFGVEIPNRQIQEKILSWRNVAELNGILEKRYQARISGEEMRQLQGKGILAVLEWLAENRGIAVQNGEAEKIGTELADRIAEEVRSLGFSPSLIDREGLMSALLKDLGSPKITDGMLRIFSVGALTDFITARIANSE